MPNSINKLIIENIYTNIVQTSRNKIFFLDLRSMTLSKVVLIL